VIELTSDSTRQEDTAKKKSLYERLGVEEYFLFDPEGDYLHPRLQGYRLEDGRYVPLEAAVDCSLTSRTTGLTLRPEGEWLRLVVTATGETLATREEMEDQLRDAEAELARLRQELDRHRD
jgi:Uma2 family endonuclease